MEKSTREEFLELLAKQTPQLRIDEPGHRSPEFLCQLFAYGTSIGAFAGLWEVLKLWVSRHANATIKVTYTAEDGSRVEVEYTNLTRGEVDEHLARRGLDVERPVRILVGSE